MECSPVIALHSHTQRVSHTDCVAVFDWAVLIIGVPCSVLLRYRSVVRRSHPCKELLTAR